jgi:hypothetical protein
MARIYGRAIRGAQQRRQKSITFASRRNRATGDRVIAAHRILRLMPTPGKWKCLPEGAALATVLRVVVRMVLQGQASSQHWPLAAERERTGR